MNNIIIQQLSDKAKNLVPKGILDVDVWIMNYNRIFTQLIIQECVQVGGPEDSYRDDWFHAKIDSINKIKKHFGVEQ